MAKKYLPIVILLLLMIPSIWFLLLPGFFESDDGEWMIIRFSAFYQALADGQFPVRFLGRLNNGYGYPVADFLYPGFMYLGIRGKENQQQDNHNRCLIFLKISPEIAHRLTLDKKLRIELSSTPHRQIQKIQAKAETK